MAESNSYLNIIVQLKDEASKQLSSFNSQLKEMQPQFKAVAAVGAASFAAVSAVAYSSLQSAQEAAAAQAQLNAVLKSTGGVAGVTADQALKLAAALQKQTTYSDESVLSAENILLTFTKISKDIFPDATGIVLDMSTALGQDLQSSAIQLGKALQDPVEGVQALRRVGVSFSQDQQDVIKNLVETGHAAEAQALIMKELSTEFGGSAKAAAETFGGQIQQVGNQVDDLKEEIGNALAPALLDLVKAVKPVIEGVIEWAKQNPELVKTIVIMAGVLSGIAAVLGTIGLILPTIIVGFGLLTGPVGLVTLAVLALVAAGVYLYTNWQTLKDNVVLIWDTMKQNIAAITTSIGNSIKERWTALKDSIAAIWQAIAQVTTEVWNGVKEYFRQLWEDIKSIFKGAYDYIMSLVQTVLNAINSVTGAAGGLARSVGSAVSNASSMVGKVLGVRDAIITPNGQVIQTDPADYLIATKNPGALGGGGVTVNVYGDVTGSDLVERVKEALMQSLRYDVKFSI